MEAGFADVDALTFGTSNGYMIQGAAGSDYIGESVSGAGDMNNDGYGDIIVSARWADPNNRYHTYLCLYAILNPHCLRHLHLI
jgi:hypothetical protein